MSKKHADGRFSTEENRNLDAIVKALRDSDPNFEEGDAQTLKNVLVIASRIEAGKTVPSKYRSDKDSPWTREQMVMLLRMRLEYSRPNVGDACAFLLSLAHTPYPGVPTRWEAIDRIDTMFINGGGAVPKKFAHVADHVRNHLEIAALNLLSVQRPLNNLFDIYQPNTERAQRNVDSYVMLTHNEIRHVEAATDRWFMYYLRLAQALVPKEKRVTLENRMSEREYRGLLETVFYSMYVYAPLCERHGKFALKNAIMDEVVHLINPQAHKELTEFRGEQMKKQVLEDLVQRLERLLKNKTPYGDYCAVSGDVKRVASIYFKMMQRQERKEVLQARLWHDQEIQKEKIAKYLGGEDPATLKGKRMETYRAHARELKKIQRDYGKVAKDIEEYRKDLEDNFRNPLAPAMIVKYLPDLWRVRIIFDSEAYEKQHKTGKDLHALESAAIRMIFDTIKAQRIFNLVEEEEEMYLDATRKPNGYEAAHLVARGEGKGEVKREIQITGSKKQLNNHYGTASHTGYKHGGAAGDFKRAKGIVVKTPKGDYIALEEGATAIDLLAEIRADIVAQIGGTVTISNDILGTLPRERDIHTPLENGDLVHAELSDRWKTDAGHRADILAHVKASRRSGVRKFYGKHGLT
jgi:hypothetical protein